MSGIIESMLPLLEGIKSMMEQQGKTDNEDYAELCANIEQLKNSEVVFDGEDNQVSDS